MPAKTFTDQRVLNVLDFIVKNNIKKIDTEAKFLKSIGYNNVNNVVNVRKGRQSFRIEHLMKICQVYKVDANYLLDKKHYKMMQSGVKSDPLANLKEAVRMIQDRLEQGQTK